MPFSDREEQLEYLRDYYSWYRLDHDDEIKARQADWYKDNKARVITTRRRNRALKRAESALEAVAVQWREILRAALVMEAEHAGEISPAMLEGLVNRVPPEEWERFLAGLGQRDRQKWEAIRV